MTTVNYKPPFELTNPTTEPGKINASIIWLHGLGADGYDFEPVAAQLLKRQGLPNARFILPHAADMAITRNNGYVMPAWYDIYGIIPVNQEDKSGIQTSQCYINELIETEIRRGIASERIVLAGFSQGGAIALHTALRYQKKLAGVLALSTYLPLHSTLESEASAINTSIPIFMAHGIFDDVISLDMSLASRNLLQTHQYAVTWREYRMAHSVCAEEITDIQDFLHKVLP